MEKNHLVSKLRNPKDARQSLVQLTETGKQIYSESKVSFDNACTDVLSFVVPEKLSELYTQVLRFKV
jgi:DNA-binding MarR family transcriptional regulator